MAWKRAAPGTQQPPDSIAAFIRHPTNQPANRPTDQLTNRPTCRNNLGNALMRFEFLEVGPGPSGQGLQPGGVYSLLGYAAFLFSVYTPGLPACSLFI